MAPEMPKVELVPWDPYSPEHTQRMYEQRLACGWRFDEVEKWRDMSKSGIKCLYWIVLSQDCEENDNLIQQHIEKSPEETPPLHDTASQVWLLSRVPSMKTFTPIGHIALDKRPDEFEHLRLPREGPIWVAGLYISWVLQKFGIGKSAMLQAEEIARAPPLSATVLVLDTIPAEQQMKGEFIERVYLDLGNPAPKMSTQAWYQRLGWTLFHRQEDAYHWLNPKTGEKESMGLVFFKKEVSGIRAST